MLTTVLLDAGGVIIDESRHEQFHAQTICELLLSHVPGYSVSQYWDDVAEAVNVYTPTVYKYIIWKHVQPDRRLFDLLAKEHALRWQRELLRPLKMLSGVREELMAISEHYGVGLAGQWGAPVLELLRTEGVLDCFQWHLTQDDFAITKPDPRYYEQIAARIGIPPEACVMVGDRIDKDIIPARQVGMKTILVRTGIHREQQPRTPWESPDRELPGVRGLADTVRSLDTESR